EPPADNPAVPEQPLHFVWVRRGADVEIFRRPVEQHVPHAAADEIRHVIVLAKAVEHLERVRIDVLARNRVLAARDDGHGLASRQFGPMPTSTVSGTASCTAPCMASRTVSATASASDRGLSISSSSWTVRIIRARAPLKRAYSASIARFRISAALPWIGKFTVIRSDAILI